MSRSRDACVGNAYKHFRGAWYMVSTWKVLVMTSVAIPKSLGGGGDSI